MFNRNTHLRRVLRVRGRLGRVSDDGLFDAGAGADAGCAVRDQRTREQTRAISSRLARKRLLARLWRVRDWSDSRHAPGASARRVSWHAPGAFRTRATRELFEGVFMRDETL